MRSLLVIAALVLAGCPKKGGGDTTPPDEGSGSGVHQPIKETVVAFTVQDLAGPQGEVPKTKVWLALTDETGASKSIPIDEIAASCSAEMGGDLGAVGTLRCWYAGAGANYIAVARNTDLIILRQWTEEGTEEPADYEELQRFPLPLGAKVTFEIIEPTDPTEP
jgi:hypothetical protein